MGYKHLLLFFALLLPVLGGKTPLPEKEMVLENRYYCDEDVLYAEDFFPNIETGFVVAEFKNRNRLQLSSRKVQLLFKEHGYEVTATHPVITVTKRSSFDKDPLKEAIRKEFLAHYPSLEIHKITVRARNFFEQGSLRLQSVEIPRPNLTKNRGSFTAFYLDEANRQKKLFFSYTLEAHITVLKAKRNMANGTILSQKNTALEHIPFAGMTAPPLGAESLDSIRIQGYVKEGSVITASMVRDIPDIVKNQKVGAVLKEGGVSVTIFATAQEDGKIGQIIKLKTDSGQVYNARVVDKNKAEIE